MLSPFASQYTHSEYQCELASSRRENILKRGLSHHCIANQATAVPYPQTNTTSKSSTSSAIVRTPSAFAVDIPPAATPNPDYGCCFVVQDVVGEEWWDVVATSSIYKVVDRTQITAHLTPYPTTTITNYEVHVQTTNASFPVYAHIGVNPIVLFGNGAPLPAQVAQANNGTALITGGVTV